MYPKILFIEKRKSFWYMPQHQVIWTYVNSVTPDETVHLYIHSVWLISHALHFNLAPVLDWCITGQWSYWSDCADAHTEPELNYTIYKCLNDHVSWGASYKNELFRSMWSIYHEKRIPINEINDLIEGYSFKATRLVKAIVTELVIHWTLCYSLRHADFTMPTHPSVRKFSLVEMQEF